MFSTLTMANALCVCDMRVVLREARANQSLQGC